MLSEVRRGHLGVLSLNMLSQLTRPLDWGEQQIVKLYPRKDDAHDENQRLLSDVPGQPVTYTSVDGGPQKAELDKKCPALRTLNLKVGVPVMLIVNSVNQNLVNGSTGTVKEFMNGYPKVDFDGKIVLVKEYTWSIQNDEGQITATRK